MSDALAPSGGSGPERTPDLELRLAPSHGWVSLGLRELWAYHEVLFFLMWRDILSRYKQTLMGFLWALLQPFLLMVVFTIFFGRLAKIPSDGLPYPLFSLAALVPWSFFADSMTRAAESTVGQANMIKKVYFPRLALPIAPVLARGVDLLIAFALLLAIMLGYGYVPGWGALWIPFFVLLAAATALGAGLWLAALNVQFRDVRMVAPFLVQLWLFLTPIAYPSSMLDQPWRTVYAINPMAGVVEGFRWALLGADTKPGGMIAVSAVAAVVLLGSGALFFRRTERTFADVV